MADYIPFDDPQVAKDSEDLIRISRERVQHMDNSVLRCILAQLPAERKKAQYKITKNPSNRVAGFTDYEVALRYTTREGTFTDTFVVMAKSHNKV